MTLPSPYPGLRPFQLEEAHLFFGREAQVEDMLARLEDHRFLAVVGTSGCGKSSLVRAGLIPALEQGFLSDAKPNWRIAVMSPGSAPFDNLTTALLGEAALGHERQSASQQAASLLQATLRRGPLGLVEAVAESHLPEDTNLLLVVDQFEEIFRYRKQTQNVNDADAFVNLLLTSAQSQQSEVPMYVVITMRSDFIGDCALFTGLPEAINDSQFLTPRLTRDQYRSAIVEPALVAGGQLDDALVNQLLNDLRGEPDQLPVLQHALMRMWTLAGDNVLKRALTLDDYKAVGGLAGALSKHCDEILHELNPEQQRIAQVMFRALCERSSEQRDTRHPAQLGEVAAIAGVDVEAVVPVVDAFRDAGRNFLMPPLPIALDAERTLDISHESLIRQWQTLNTWVEVEAESARQYQRLEDAAKRRQQRVGAELWRGVDLENARVWKKHERPTEAWAARYGDAYQLAMDFLEASEAEEEKQRHEHERAHQRELEQAREFAEMQSARAEEQAARAAEQARAASRLRAITAVIGVLLLVTISVAIYAFHQRNRAAAAQHGAKTAQELAEEKEKDAVRAAEEAKRQQDIAAQQSQVAVERLARYFSAMSKASIEVQPTLSILLSIEALKVALIPAAEEALRDAITKIASNTTLVGHEKEVVGVAFSPDGQVLATTSADQTVRLWSLSNPTAEPRVLRGHEKEVGGVAFSPDGQVLATTSWDQTVRLWSLSNPTAEPRVLRGAMKKRFGALPSVRMARCSRRRAGTRRYACGHSAIQPRSPACCGAMKKRFGALPSVRMARCSRRRARTRRYACGHSAIQPRSPACCGAMKKEVVGVAFSPDGQVLATTSADQTVRLWSLSNPTAEPRVLRGHEKEVGGVAFSPDGQVLATTSWDQTIRLWSLSNPTAKPRVLRGHEKEVWGVAFSPDGQVLATTSADQTIRLWSMVIDDLVRIACLLTSGNFRHGDWQQYLGEEPYRTTCPNRPLHPSFLEILREQVKNGDREGAVEKLRIALQVDSVSDVVLQKEMQRLEASALVEKGRELARGGDIDGAVVAFQQAFELDPNLALDPEKEAQQLAASGLVDKGQELAKQGAIREALAAIKAAQASDSNLEIAAASWNVLCWFGSLWGFATDVMAACERAVALEPDHGGIRDSRGVARALSEDYPGAINDFQQYLEWGPKNGQSEEQIRQRQDWIRMLQANQNPFNKELLKLLRDE